MNENRPYFSIIMPVYNGEKYIGTMLESIIGQSFSDWELIVINDASTDQSKTIAESYCRRDSRIRLLHLEENLGVSNARNKGISEAKGRYIWFADADDCVDNHLLQSVWESLQENPAKLVLFGLIEEYYDAENQYQYSHKVVHPARIFRKKEELRPEMIYLEQETLYGYLWNKIYDLDYLKKIHMSFAPYEQAKFIEDIKFNVEYCMDIDSLNILEICPYHYAKRMQNNLTNEFAPDYFKFHKRRIEMLLEQYKYWNLCTEEVQSILGSLYARYILSTLQRNCDKRSGMHHKQRKDWCKKLFRQELFQELIPKAKAKDSRVLQILIGFLRREQTAVCLMMGRAVYIIRNKLPVVYSKVKSGR